MELDNLEFPLDEARPLKVHLDRWLWAARFFKTRAIARKAIESGQIFYNGEPSQPGREIELGATLSIHYGRTQKVVTITGLSNRRRNITDAQNLYEEQASKQPIGRFLRRPLQNRSTN